MKLETRKQISVAAAWIAGPGVLFMLFGDRQGQVERSVVFVAIFAILMIVAVWMDYLWGEEKARRAHNENYNRQYGERSGSQLSWPQVYVFVTAVFAAIAFVVRNVNVAERPVLSSPLDWRTPGIAAVLGFFVSLVGSRSFLRESDGEAVARRRQERRSQVEYELKTVEYPRFRAGEGDFYEFAREEQTPSDRLKECQADPGTLVTFLLEGSPFRIDRWLEKRDLLGQEVEEVASEETEAEAERRRHQEARDKLNLLISEAVNDKQFLEEKRSALLDLIEPELEGLSEEERALRIPKLIELKLRQLKRTASQAP